jgi:hypothetical protein
MATYLQGVTDYIPDYQPFQPDLNFYGNLLQTKQTQYDSNWKQLNNLYGQLYGADLTHDLNIQKKDQLLKQIDFNLKRVSGLDLSLEQNVNQAMQVFRPFYEDKYLMKDMAWTKNWKNTYESSNALKTSQDDKQRKTWWGTGIQGLELRRQMFKDATLDETLGMANATYTPFVNAVTEYMDLAKKYNIGAVQQLPDASGLYLVRKKNGELILPTLQNLFLAEYGNRPDIQDMYREEAFVERMNYAYQNKDKFGSSLEAEKDYIKTKYDYIKNYAEKSNNKAQDELNTTKDLKANLEKDINSGDVRPQQSNYGRSLDELFAVNATVAQTTEQLNNQVNDKQATATVKGYDEDILADLDLARLKVDAGFASIRAEQDIQNAANSYATANMEVEYKANPVGLEFLRHKHASQRQSQSHQDRLAEIDKQNEAKMFQKAVDYNVGKGYWSFDDKGRLNTNPQTNGFNLNFLMPNDAGGNTEGKFTFDELQKMSKDQMAAGVVESGDHLMKTIQNGVNTNAFTSAQLAQFLDKLSLNKSDRALVNDVIANGSTAANKAQMKRIWGNIWQSYSTSPNEYVKGLVKTSQIYNLNDIVKDWTLQHQGSKLTELYNTGEASLKLEQSSRVNDALMSVRQSNWETIKKKFTDDLSYIVSEVKEKDPKTYGNITQERINAAVNLVMNRYALDGNGHLEEFKKLAPQIDKEVASILGFNIGKSTNQKADAKWYNYVFPLTNIPRMMGDGRENVKDQASWVGDVFDQSFEELTKLDPAKGGLQPYFANVTRSGTGNQYGLAAETGVMKVAPGINWDPGNQAASSMFNTILGTLWSQDNQQYRITTEGNIRPEDPESATGIEQNEALAIVRELQGRLNTDKELAPFFVGASTISMESEKLGSMKLMAPRDVIEKVIKSMAGDDVKESDIKTKIDKIYQNGITFIAPKTTWQGNQLFNRQYPTATEILLRQKPLEYKDPSGSGKYVIQKSPGTGDYLSSVEVFELMPDGSKKAHEPYYWNHNVRSGKTIDEKELENKNILEQVKTINFDRFRQIVQSGDQEKIQRAQANFGMSVTDPYWNYNK